MSKCFEIGTKVIVQSDVLEKMGGDPYVNNCWEVIDTSRDREDNVMHWLKNTETEWEPEQFFYFEELHELQDLTELSTSELMAKQSDSMQEMLCYIEHAEEDALLVCEGRGTKDQDLNSVVSYLESAVEVAKILALGKNQYTCPQGEKEEALPEHLNDTINKELNKRQYVITWKPGCYATDELCKVVSLDYFTKDNGFGANEVEDIHNLDIGDACKIDTGYAFVTRLFDKA